MHRRLTEHIWTTSFSPLPHSAPYAIPHCHWRGNFQEQVQTHINKKREQNPPETKMEEKKQDETSGSWFKITVSVLEKWN